MGDLTVKKPPSSYLKLYSAEAAFEPTAGRCSVSYDLESLYEAFHRATGWDLKALTRSNSWRGASAGDLRPDRLPIEDIRAVTTGQRLTETGPSNDPLAALPPREPAQRLAQAIGDLVSALACTENAVKQRDAELATAIPFVSHPEQEPFHLATRLEAVLRGGAQAVGCHAAALYMLDDATSALKLRVQWGLPANRLLAPPRELEKAIGDLEALTGHAVVLERTDELPHWNVPEPFPFLSAVCIPVASATVPLGTMWVFSTIQRSFSNHETNLLEIVAGRLAVELERQILLRENASLRKSSQLVQAMQTWQQGRSAKVAPVIEGWEIAAELGEDRLALSRDVCEWHFDDRGAMLVSLANVHNGGLPGLLTASWLSGALRSHPDSSVAPGDHLGHMNHALWAGAAGDRHASLFHAVVQPRSGAIDFAVAGRIRVYLLSPEACKPIAPETVVLGVDADSAYPTTSHRLAIGDSIVVLGVSPDLQPHQSDSCETAGEIASLLASRSELTAAQMVDLVQDANYLSHNHGSAPSSVLIAKRTG